MKMWGMKQEDAGDRKLMEWLAYAHFHHGEHDKALLLYKELLEMPDTDPMYHTYAAACLFYMADYNEAHEAALQGIPPVRLCVEFLTLDLGKIHCRKYSCSLQ
jgi:tetratricopeptide (TPR) repeat protein